jgi:hypothetical protein
MSLLEHVTRSRAQARVLLVMMLAVPAGAARAGGFTACESPFIFEDAAANVVPVEYLATAADTGSGDQERLRQVQQTAQRLAWLIKLDSWHQATYGSLGVVAHMFLAQKCDPDEVLDGLLAGRTAGPVPSGQILLMLQGKIFIEGEDIYLQSRLRGFRRNSIAPRSASSLNDYFEREEISTRIGDGSHSLEAAVPVLDITFAARSLSLAELEEVDSVFAEASIVHAQPSDSSSGERLRFEPDQPRAFQVQIIEGGQWLRISDFFSGFSGYIRSNPEASRFLHGKLPELDFLNGALGYLRVRQAETGLGDFPSPPQSAARTAEQSFQRFLREHDAFAEEMDARALAFALMGSLAAEQAGEWPKARQLVAEATREAPYRSEYRNMLGVLDAHLCCAAAPTGEFGDPARAFTDSLSLAPDNVQALTNLHGFLDALTDLAERDSVPAGINASRLTDRRDVVRKIISETK